MSDYVPWFEGHQTCVDHIWETINKANTFTLSLNFNKRTFFFFIKQTNKKYHLQMQD